MQLESVAVDQLRPAPYNPRIPLRPGDSGWEKLRRSLVEFDLVQPIVWNRRTGHVVGGHQRLEVLRHEGRTSVECVVVDLPLEREQALNVALNNSSVGSDWDPDKLVDLLSELKSLPDFDATLTGYDAQQLRDLLFEAEPASLVHDEEDVDSGGVSVTLAVPYDRWSSVRRSLDQLLLQEPAVRLHITLPGD